MQKPISKKPKKEKKPKEQEVFRHIFNCTDCRLNEFLDGYEFGYEDAKKDCKNTLVKGTAIGSLIVSIAWIISLL